MQIEWGGNSGNIGWVGQRPLYQFWPVLVPYFRDVLLPPQRKSGQDRVSWQWRDAERGVPISPKDIAVLRQRLQSRWQWFVDGSASGEAIDRGAGGVPNANSGTIAQLQKTMESWIQEVCRRSDKEFARYVCRTDQGCRIHSWGAWRAAEVSLQDCGEIAGAVTVEGKAFGGCEVLIARLGDGAIWRHVTTRDGRYFQKGMKGGSYVLTPKAARITFSPATVEVYVGETGVHIADFHGVREGVGTTADPRFHRIRRALARVGSWAVVIAIILGCVWYLEDLAGGWSASGNEADKAREREAMRPVPRIAVSRKTQAHSPSPVEVRSGSEIHGAEIPVTSGSRASDGLDVVPGDAIEERSSRDWAGPDSSASGPPGGSDLFEEEQVAVPPSPKLGPANHGAGIPGGLPLPLTGARGALGETPTHSGGLKTLDSPSSIPVQQTTVKGLEGVLTPPSLLAISCRPFRWRIMSVLRVGSTEDQGMARIRLKAKEPVSPKGGAKIRTPEAVMEQGEASDAHQEGSDQTDMARFKAGKHASRGPILETLRPRARGEIPGEWGRFVQIVATTPQLELRDDEVLPTLPTPLGGRAPDRFAPSRDLTVKRREVAGKIKTIRIGVEVSNVEWSSRLQGNLGWQVAAPLGLFRMQVNDDAHGISWPCGGLGSDGRAVLLDPQGVGIADVSINRYGDAHIELVHEAQGQLLFMVELEDGYGPNDAVLELECDLPTGSPPVKTACTNDGHTAYEARISLGASMGRIGYCIRSLGSPWVLSGEIHVKKGAEY